MRSRKNLRLTQKPIYFLASVVLHMFLGGLLIYFYVSFSGQPGKQEKSPEPSEIKAHGKNPIAPQAPLPSPLEELSFPATSVPEKNTMEKFEESKSLERNVRSENPTLATPKKDGLVAPSHPSPGKKPASQNSGIDKGSHMDKGLESNLSSPKQYPAAPAAHPGRKGMDKSLLAVEPTASETNITRAQFTTGVEQREPEPIDQVGPVILANSKGIKQLYYFTEVKGMKGETIIHRWEHEGQVVAKVQLQIGSNLWRTYSSKNLTPAMTGDWRVVVTDSQGHPLHSGHFVYIKP